MAWLLYGSLIVMVLVALRGLHVLGRVTQQRDEALWGQDQLIDQNKLLYEANQILAAQNTRLIDYHSAQKEQQKPEFEGNVFPTE